MFPLENAYLAMIIALDVRMRLINVWNAKKVIIWRKVGACLWLTLG